MIVFISCTKKTEKKVLPPPVDTWTPYTVPPQPELKLTRMVIRTPESSGTTHVSTTIFTYDDKHRLLMAREVETNMILVQYRYVGDELRKEIYYDYDGSISSEYDSSMIFSRLGDTITIRYENIPNLTEITLLFRDSVMVESRRSEKYGDDPAEVMERFVWAYTPNKNLQQNSHGYYNDPLQVRYRILAVDNRRNPFRDISIFAQLSSSLLSHPYLGMGANNVTRVQRGDGITFDIQYTYNDEGYPRTLTFSNGKVIELEYSR
jgi:hypothetical protein